MARVQRRLPSFDLVYEGTPQHGLVPHRPNASAGSARRGGTAPPGIRRNGHLSNTPSRGHALPAVQSKCGRRVNFMETLPCIPVAASEGNLTVARRRHVASTRMQQANQASQEVASAENSVAVDLRLTRQVDDANEADGANEGQALEESHDDSSTQADEHTVQLPAQLVCNVDSASFDEHCRWLAISLAQTTVEATLSSCAHTGTSAAMTTREVEMMREVYLVMIRRDPLRIMRDLAAPMKAELLKSAAGSALLQGPMREVEIAVRGRTVPIQKQEMFSFGKIRPSDVLLKTSSRLHCCMFNFPGGIVVVDGWSLVGTCIVRREHSERGFATSTPNNRCVFVIPHDEAITLQMGHEQEEITINPKLCSLCAERPRSVRLSCGHQAFCNHCITQAIADGHCPLCRAPVDMSEIEKTNGAAVNATYACPLPIQNSAGCADA